MSFIQSTLKCQKCGYEMNVAFGIQGMTQIAGWPEKCAECGSHQLEKISDGWNADNTPKKKRRSFGKGKTMKQHITADDLNQLSEKEKERLYKYLKLDYLKEDGRCRYCNHYPNDYTPHQLFDEPGKYCLGKEQSDKMFLSIGQMIEFLDQNNSGMLFIDRDKTNYVWGTSFFGKRSGYVVANRWGFQQKIELCDALFSAVKEVLERE